MQESWTTSGFLAFCISAGSSFLLIKYAKLGDEKEELTSLEPCVHLIHPGFSWPHIALHICQAFCRPVCCGAFACCRSSYNCQCSHGIAVLICTGYGKSLPASLMRKMIPRLRYHGGCLIWKRIGQPCSSAVVCEMPLMYTGPLDRCERLTVGGRPCPEKRA